MTAEEECRRAFEEWASAQGYGCHKYYDGTYRAIEWQQRWIGWQAAWNTRAPRQENKPDRFHDEYGETWVKDKSSAENKPLVAFVESITNAIGPYPDLNGHRIVADAYSALSQHQAQPVDLGKCPRCGGPADNGHDRCLPPSPYACTKCTAAGIPWEEKP